MEHIGTSKVKSLHKELQSAAVCWFLRPDNIRVSTLKQI